MLRVHCEKIWQLTANALKPHHGRAIDEAAWETILNSFDLMAQGIDENGEVLYQDSDGKIWKFDLLFAQGDMEQLCQGWGLPSYNSIDQICGMCLADRTELGNNYTDMQEWANWRSTCPITNDVQTYFSTGGDWKATSWRRRISACITIMFPALEATYFSIASSRRKWLSSSHGRQRSSKSTQHQVNKRVRTSGEGSQPAKAANGMQQFIHT